MNLILFRYILKQFALIFLTTLFVLVMVVMLFDVIELLRNAAKHENVSFMDVGVLAILKSPQMVHIILPFITLIAGLIFLFKFDRTLRWSLEVNRIAACQGQHGFILIRKFTRLSSLKQT